jgi:hypothetical protein
MTRQTGNLPSTVAEALAEARRIESEKPPEPQTFVFEGTIQMKVVVTDHDDVIARWFRDVDLQTDHRFRTPAQVAHAIGWQHIVNCLDNPQIDLSTMPAYAEDDEVPGEAQCFLTIRIA